VNDLDSVQRQSVDLLNESQIGHPRVINIPQNTIHVVSKNEHTNRK